MARELTLERLIFDRAGLVRGAPVAAYMGAWIVVTRKLGKFPTVAEVTAESGRTERTVWNWRRRIRQYFTEDEFQTLVLAAAQSRKRDPLAVVLDDFAHVA